MIWIIFILLVLILLAIDLGVFNKSPEIVGAKKAGFYTTIWVTLALSFSGVIYLIYDQGWIDNPNELQPFEALLLYLTGYLVELSLSMDNIFVMSLIFGYFAIPKQYQHRVLFWGILGAVVFRAIMILVGVALIEKFHWMIYLLGGVLLYSAYKMATEKDEEMDFENNRIVRMVKKLFPVTKEIEGEQFFVRKRWVLAATPLFIVLVIIEVTDVVFAVDSIPAILGITTEEFIVFTSNIFAILGLRSMYFLLDSLLSRFHYLKYSLIFILSFVGLKMMLSGILHLPTFLSLLVIVIALGVGLIISLARKPHAETPSI